MHTDYTKYSADQLLNDDYFLQSELHPTEESRLFWQNLMEENEPLAAEIEIARLLLNALEKDTEIPSLTSTEENTLWQQIEQTNIETERKKQTFPDHKRSFQYCCDHHAFVCCRMVYGF